MQKKQVGIVLFKDVEVLDFCGPFEVFSVTRLDDRRREESSPFEVQLVASTLDAVTTTGGMRVLPTVTWSACPKLDILVIPGGWVVRREVENEAALLAFVRERAQQVDTLASVCTGSFILAKAGLLQGRRATTHWRSLGLMQEKFPDVHVDTQSHVVQDGNIFTSAGISAGIDMALHVVAKYFGEPVARATARHMEYPYPDSNVRRVQL